MDQSTNGNGDSCEVVLDWRIGIGRLLDVQVPFIWAVAVTRERNELRSTHKKVDAFHAGPLLALI